MKINCVNLTQCIKDHPYDIIFGLCALCLVYVILVTKKKIRSNFPPGPLGLPILGYSPFLTKDVHLDFMELGKKYGDVVSVRLGSEDFVILNGADAIIEAFHKHEFLGRPPKSGLDTWRSTSTFIGGNFSLWKEQRKFVVQSMKDLGLGKTRIEEAVMVEINHFIDFLRSQKSQPVDIMETLSSSISNNICALVFGKRLEYDDPKRHFLDKNLDEIFKHTAQTSMDALFPWIYYIPFASKFMETNRTRIACENLEKFFQEEIDEHIKVIDPAHLRDFIDRYLIEIDAQKVKNPNTSFNHTVLMNNAIDLFLAGSHPVIISILWFIYIVAAFPDVQEKVQEEILEVIGSEKAPEYTHMRNMPYTHAVMLEIMRWKTILALNLVHYTLDDTTVGGYHLPKAKSVIANFWAVHHDPRYWDEPEKFNPERFLGKDGKSVVKPKYFMPFSRGSRACPGESMAYLEMFLYFTSILQEFDVTFPDGTQPTFEAKFVLNYELEPYVVRFIPKNTRILSKEVNKIL